MKVTVEVVPEKDGEIVAATITDAADADHTIKSGTANSVYSGMLEEGDVLEVKAGATTQLVMDQQQSSAKEEPVGKEEVKPAMAAPKSPPEKPGPSKQDVEEEDSHPNSKAKKK